MGAEKHMCIHVYIALGAWQDSTIEVSNVIQKQDWCRALSSTGQEEALPLCAFKAHFVTTKHD